METEKTISKAKKRWIVRELESGRISQAEALELISGYSKNPWRLIKYWCRQFSSDISFTLPVMTEKEKQKLAAAHKRMKALERQLEQAQMKNIALETMIDVAEEQLKISIRKKSGPKQ